MTTQRIEEIKAENAELNRLTKEYFATNKELRRETHAQKLKINKLQSTIERKISMQEKANAKFEELTKRANEDYKKVAELQDRCDALVKVANDDHNENKALKLELQRQTRLAETRKKLAVMLIDELDEQAIKGVE